MSQPSKTVTCLGGAGGMGKTLARHLAQSEHIKTLIIADLDGEGAAALAQELGKTAACDIKSEQVNVLEDTEMNTLLERTDFLANAAGPFFRLGVPTLRAAINTSTPYLDICDDPGPTLEMMALDSLAKEKSVGAVIGMGASPGLSNLLAKRAASRLDRVRDCYTAWPLDVSAPGEDASILDEEQGDGVSAAAVHLMMQISGTVHVVKDGALTSIPPLEEVTLNYPGMGEGAAVVVGHPEPVTLHKSLNVEGTAANIMLVKPATAQFLRFISKDIDRGRLSLDQAASLLMDPKGLRALKAAVFASRSKGPGALPPFFAWVRGEKDGQEKIVGCHATTLPLGMDGVTSIPAALAIDMLLQNPAGPGVHAPEEVINADILLDRLRAHCPVPPGSVDELAPINEEMAPSS